MNMLNSEQMLIYCFILFIFLMLCVLLSPQCFCWTVVTVLIYNSLRNSCTSSSTPPPHLLVAVARQLQLLLFQLVDSPPQPPRLFTSFCCRPPPWISSAPSASWLLLLFPVCSSFLFLTHPEGNSKPERFCSNAIYMYIDIKYNTLPSVIKY